MTIFKVHFVSLAIEQFTNKNQSTTYKVLLVFPLDSLPQLIFVLVFFSLSKPYVLSVAFYFFCYFLFDHRPDNSHRSVISHRSTLQATVTFDA